MNVFEDKQQFVSSVKEWQLLQLIDKNARYQLKNNCCKSTVSRFPTGVVMIEIRDRLDENKFHVCFTFHDKGVKMEAFSGYEIGMNVFVNLEKLKEDYEELLLNTLQGKELDDFLQQVSDKYESDNINI